MHPSKNHKTVLLRLFGGLLVYVSSPVAQKIEKFFSSYRLQKYPKGRMLILHGAEPEYVFQLVKGKVKQYDVTARGDEIILNVFKPPAFFPMSLAINKAPSQHIYEAETAIDIRQVPVAEAVAFVQDNPDVMFDLLSRVYRGVDGVLGRMAQLMSSSAGSRLAYELLLEARRFGDTKSDKSVLLKLNESELAARAGLTRETVSREIKKLKAADAVSLQNGTITIKSLAKIQKLIDREV